MADNFTPIDKLVKSSAVSHTGMGKEGEPQTKIEDVDLAREEINQTTDSNISDFVGVVPDSINLPPEIKQAGVMSEPQIPDYQRVKIPLADDKLIEGSRAPFTSSLHWLTALAFYIFKQAHIGIRVVHGHVVRVFKR